jgi:hypothetical protein
MTNKSLLTIRPLALGLLMLAGLLPVPAFSQQDAAKSELADLRKKVEELDNLAVRSQSHMMMDVEYQFANLWFAAKSGQWDLAAFFMRETKSHVAWTVRVRPVRNVAGGGTVELAPFQQALETGLTAIDDALKQKDMKVFTTAYQQTLTQCHACHQAAGLGYLDPHIPEHAPSALMIKGK